MVRFALFVAMVQPPSKVPVLFRYPNPTGPRIQFIQDPAGTFSFLICTPRMQRPEQSQGRARITGPPVILTTPIEFQSLKLPPFPLCVCFGACPKLEMRPRHPHTAAPLLHEPPALPPSRCQPGLTPPYRFSPVGDGFRPDRNHWTRSRRQTASAKSLPGTEDLFI